MSTYSQEAIGSFDLRRFLLVATVFSIPFAGYGIETGVVTLSVPNLLIMTTVSVIAWESMVGDSQLTVSNLDIGFLFVFTSVLLIGSVSTLVNGGGLRWFPTTLGWILLFGVVSIGVRDRNDLWWIFQSIFMSAVLICILAIVSSLFHINLGGTNSFYSPRSALGYQMPFTRTVGINLSHGEFGMYVTSILPLYLVTGLRQSKLPYYLGTGIILFTVIFISQGRSTWLAAFVGLSTLFFLHPLRWRMTTRMNYYYRLLRLFSVVLVPIIVAGLFFLFLEIGGSIDSRMAQITKSITLVVSNPLFGLGWEQGINRYFDGLYPHNAFLRYGVTLGGLVLILLITTVLMGIYISVRSLASAERGNYAVTASLLCGFLSVLVEANLLVGFGKVFPLWLAILAIDWKLGARTV